MRRGVIVPGVVVVLAWYAWWSTGVRPFTGSAYLSVGLPTLVVAVVTVACPGARSAASGRAPSLGSCLPWLVLLALGAVLEGIGLGLGGRSPTVPTLSTVIDHALRWHVVRFGLFGLWLVVGGAPRRRRTLPGGTD